MTLLLPIMPIFIGSIHKVVHDAGQLQLADMLHRGAIKTAMQKGVDKIGFVAYNINNNRDVVNAHRKYSGGFSVEVCVGGRRAYTELWVVA